MNCGEKHGQVGKESAIFMCLLCLILEPGYPTAQLLRITVKLGPWTKVTEVDATSA